MADYTQTSSPLVFPRDGASWPPSGSPTETVSLIDGTTFEYEPGGIIYTYDLNVNSWTGGIGGGTVPGIPDFPIDIPGKIPDAAAGKYIAEGDLEVSLNELGPYSNEVEVPDGTTADVWVKWTDASLDQKHDTDISGSVRHEVDGNVVSQSFAGYTLKRVPSNDMSQSISDVALNTEKEFTPSYPTGFGDGGETTFVYGTGTATNIQIQINSGGYAPLPTSAASGIELIKDTKDVIQIKATSSSTTDTETSVTLSFTDKKGTEVDRGTLSLTTAAATPAIETPTIDSPLSGSTDLKPDVELVGSTYTPLNGASATHQSSDWEVYEGGYPLTSTNTITKVTTETEFTWEGREVPPGAGALYQLNDITYGDNTWMIASTYSSGYTFRSTNDGESWDAISGGLSGTNPYGITWILWEEGFSKFICCAGIGSAGRTLRSETGGGIPHNTWVDVVGMNIDIKCGAHDGVSTLVFGRDSTRGDYIYESTGGTFNSLGLLGVKAGVGTTQPIRAANNGTVGEFMVIDYEGAVSFTSDSGSTFSASNPYSNRGYAVAYGDGMWMIAGQVSASQNCEIKTSTNNGTSWTTVGTIPVGSNNSDEITDLKYGNGFWIATATARFTNNVPLIYTSADGGATWTPNVGRPLGMGETKAVEYANGKFMVLSDWNKNLYVSPGPDTVIEIDGTRADGFKVDDIITNCGAAGPSTLKEINLSDTEITISPGSSDYSVGDNICRDSSSFSQVVNSLNDTTNLEKYTLTDSEMEVNNTYYSRVKYRSADPIESEWSDWNEFDTANTFLPEPGEEMGGGYWGGQINDSGKIYNIIVAPKKWNSLYGDMDNWPKPSAGGTSDAREPLLASPGAIASPDTAGVYGGPTTEANLGNGMSYSVVFHFFSHYAGPNAGNDFALDGSKNGTGIGGFNDWYLPARQELQIIYYWLKPTTDGNGGSDSAQTGILSNAVPPVDNGVLWDSQTIPPTQTPNPLFKKGGAQQFKDAYGGSSDQDHYWTVTRGPRDDQEPIGIGFKLGQTTWRLYNHLQGKCRAIRRQPA